MSEGCAAALDDAISQLELTASNMSLYPRFFSDVDCGTPDAQLAQTYIDFVTPANGYFTRKSFTDHGVSAIPKSFLLPENFKLTYANVGQAEVTIEGPYTITNTYEGAGAKDAVKGTGWTGDTTIQFELLRTVDQYKVDMCMGAHVYTFGVPKILNDYTPRQPQCDQFMTDYCQNKTKDEAPECACFIEQFELDKDYPDLSLSVACFGDTCRKGRSYETAEMYQNTCSVPFCSDQIQKHSGDFTDKGKTTITCGSADFKIPSPDEIPIIVTVTTPHDDEGWPSWAEPLLIVACALAAGVVLALCVVYIH